MDMDMKSVGDELAALLRDKPRGTTADISAHTSIYWNGTRPVGAHLCVDHPGFDDRFELDQHFYGDAQDHLLTWFADPQYSSRPDLVAWLDDAPDVPSKGD
jgi:hypothetical protein